MPAMRVRREDSASAASIVGDAEDAGGRPPSRRRARRPCLRHKHAGQRIARGRIREFGVSRLFPERESALASRSRRLPARSRTCPVKKSSAAIARLRRDDRGAERQHGCGIIGRRIVIGERAAQRAAMADGGIADRSARCGERRDACAQPRSMSRHRRDVLRRRSRVRAFAADEATARPGPPMSTRQAGSPDAASSSRSGFARPREASPRARRRARLGVGERTGHGDRRRDR